MLAVVAGCTASVVAAMMAFGVCFYRWVDALLLILSYLDLFFYWWSNQLRMLFMLSYFLLELLVQRRSTRSNDQAQCTIFNDNSVLIQLKVSESTWLMAVWVMQSRCSMLFHQQRSRFIFIIDAMMSVMELIERLSSDNFFCGEGEAVQVP